MQQASSGPLQYRNEYFFDTPGESRHFDPGVSVALQLRPSSYFVLNIHGLPLWIQEVLQAFLGRWLEIFHIVFYGC